MHSLYQRNTASFASYLQFVTSFIRALNQIFYTMNKYRVYT
ncbi:hypothetical protein PSPO_b0782 [Pseudoalteromonas spongiae UST010723-006]|nr:hypothetical protein PSPO_b0782 [Pseudoalteromonas spongiae UST010723-006]